MAITQNVKCDRCGAGQIDNSYWFSVDVDERLPRDGGISTGSEVHAQFTYCQKCKTDILRHLLDFLRAKP